MTERKSGAKAVLLSVLGCTGIVLLCTLGICAIGMFAPLPQAARDAPEPTGPADPAADAPESPASSPAPVASREPTPPAAQRPRCPTFNSRFGPVEGEHVGRDVMGEEWPLTVDGGCLYCDPVGAVVFVHAGETYGINGTAHRYGEVEPIWRESSEVAGARHNIGPLIQRGRHLCAR